MVASGMAADIAALLSSTSARTLTVGLDKSGRVLQHDRAAGEVLAEVPASLLGTDFGTLVIEIPEEDDEQDLSSVAITRITWLHRLGAAAGDPAALAAEAAEVDFPPGRGHAYLFGEAKVVLRLREILADRGLGEDQMSPKAYWGRGRANASHGEPARDA